MPVQVPPGMPPWWNTQIACRHCGVFIKAFIPKQQNAWQRELEALKDKASDRCYCRKTAGEILELLGRPEEPMKEHTLHRVWLQWALQYRYRECGEGKAMSEAWYKAAVVPGLVVKLPPKEPKNKSAAPSGKRR